MELLPFCLLKQRFLLLGQLIALATLTSLLCWEGFHSCLILTDLFLQLRLLVLSCIFCLSFNGLEIFHFSLKKFHLFNQAVLLISQLEVFILSFLHYGTVTFILLSTSFFIVWYFWLESTIFLTNGSLVRLITPQRLLPSLCCCFYLSSFISIVIKWICFRRFSMY